MTAATATATNKLMVCITLRIRIPPLILWHTRLLCAVFFKISLQKSAKNTGSEDSLKAGKRFPYIVTFP